MARFRKDWLTEQLYDGGKTGQKESKSLTWKGVVVFWLVVGTADQSRSACGSGAGTQNPTVLGELGGICQRLNDAVLLVHGGVRSLRFHVVVPGHSIQHAPHRVLRDHVDGP